MALVLQGAHRAVRAAAPMLLSTTRSVTDRAEHNLKGARGFSEHEQAVENLYFNKEDERILRKLLNKVKQQSDKADEPAAVTAAATEEATLRTIVGKYNVSKADMDALIAWKHSH